MFSVPGNSGKWPGWLVYKPYFLVSVFDTLTFGALLTLEELFLSGLANS